MTEAPSIKEALEIVENLIRRDPACFNLSDELLPVRAALRARATLSPPAGERREAIARIIGPTVFMESDYPITENVRARLRRQTLAKADKILASGLVQNEAGHVLAPIEPTPEMIAAAWAVINAAKQNAGIARLGSGLGVSEVYRVMIAAIRSASDGGAET